uniref:Uncharacterized protein n=1 Tax=Vespula pensylvanica TaxID=30213 RepID=A0A834PC85_VESPE|nr:hypothetical protein H0235_003840 [Vespula pensylvanica]
MLLYKDGCSQREEIPRVRGAFKRSDYTPLKDFLRARAPVVAVREEKMVVKDVEKKGKKKRIPVTCLSGSARDWLDSGRERLEGQGTTSLEKTVTSCAGVGRKVSKRWCGGGGGGGGGVEKREEEEEVKEEEEEEEVEEGGVRGGEESARAGHAVPTTDRSALLPDLATG